MEHFKDGERGFSIKLDGPLDMRYDTTVGISAYDWLHKVNLMDFQKTLEKYTDFGDTYRERIVKEWIVVRRKQNIETT